MNKNTENIQAACKTSVAELLAQHADKWGTRDSAVTVKAALSAVSDKDGNAVTLTDEENDIIDAIADPTGEVIKRVLSKIASNHGAELEEKAKSLLRMVIDPAQFRQKLAGAGKIKIVKKGPQVNVEEVLG
jgi:chemotaxis regulatin CheY-phosphate phosphatase CheZ